MLGSRTKHVLHCCLLTTVILAFELLSGGIRWNSSSKQSELNPWTSYGYFGALVLYLLRVLTFLSLPQVLFNFIGLTLYNAFPEKVSLIFNFFLFFIFFFQTFIEEYFYIEDKRRNKFSHIFIEGCDEKYLQKVILKKADCRTEHF